MKTKLENLLFDVEKLERTEFDCLSGCSYDVAAYPYINKAFTPNYPVLFDSPIVPVRTKIGIQTCSNVYELVPNSQIFPNIRQTIFNSGHTFSEEYDMQDYSMFMAKFVLTDVEIAIKSANDKIQPQIVIYHSYNGVRKYTIKFGFYRLICLNGLTVPVKELEFLNLQIGGKHTISIKHSLEVLMSRITYICNNMTELTKGFNLLANEEVTDYASKVIEIMAQVGINERLKKVDPKAPKGSAREPQATNEILLTIKEESNKYYGGEVNNWLIYNALNRYIYSENNKEADEKREVKDRKVMSILMA